MKRPALKFAIFIVFAAAAFGLARYTGAIDSLGSEDFKTRIEGYGVWAPLVYILIFSIAPSLLLPGLPITVAGGIIFGPVRGIIYTSIGSTIGASLAFLFARYMAREWVKNAIKGTKFATLDSEVEKRGWRIVAITRLIPLFPFNMLNYAFGLTGVKFSHYAAASFVFMLPGIAAYVLLSSSILPVLKGEVRAGFIVGATLAAIILTLPLLYKRWKKNG